MVYLSRGINKIQKDGPYRFIIDSTKIIGNPSYWYIFLLTNFGLDLVTRTDLKQIDEKIIFGNGDAISIEGSENYPYEFQQVIESYEFEKPFVAEIKEGFLFGNEALPLDPKGNPILDGMMGRKDQVENMLLKNPIEAVKLVLGNFNNYERRINKMVCPLPSRHFPHWILNELPRLHGLKIYEEKTGFKPAIVLRSPVRKFQIESLELFGINQERIIEWDGATKKFDSIIIPSVRSPELNISNLRQKIVYDLTYKVVSPSALRWVCTHGQNTISNSNSPKRLFIPRTDTERRRILNRDELVTALDSLGFESYIPSEYSFVNQVQTFSNAEVIVAPHGGALANLVFSSEATVLELFGKKIKPTFFLLAKLLDINYDFLICEPDNNDIIVDVETIIKYLNNVI